MSPEAGRQAAITRRHSLPSIPAILRRASGAFAIAALGLAAACSESPTAPTPTKLHHAGAGDLVPVPGDLIPPPPTDADQVVTILLPFMQPTAVNPCNGDVLTLMGDQSATFYIKNEPDGNQDIKIYFKTVDVRASAVTADVPPQTVPYYYRDVVDYYYDIDEVTSIDETANIMTVMTRRDESEWQSYYLPDDYFFKEHVHVKLYNGVPTAWVEQVDSDCQR